MDTKFSHNIRVRSTAKGFSILELMVAIAILAMLSSISLAGFVGLNNRVNVDTLAHNIAQWLRDAQISSMSVRRSAITNTFPPGYGLHFSTAQNNQFIYYREASSPANKIYNAGTDGIENTIQLLQGYTISSIVPTPAGSTNWVDIAFARPEPDAVITGATGIYSPVRIIISSPRGLQRAVVIYATGQVSIQTP